MEKYKRIKKLNKMSFAELILKKESLEEKTLHEKMTKSKKDPKKVKWYTDDTNSKYYKEIVNEIKKRVNANSYAS